MGGGRVREAPGLDGSDPGARLSCPGERDGGLHPTSQQCHRDRARFLRAHVCHRLHRRNVSVALGNRARRSCLALAGASPGSATHRGDAGDGGCLTLAAGLRGAGGWTAGACCPALPGAPQSCTPCACRAPAPAIWGCQAGGPPSTSQPPQGAAWPVGCFGGTVSLCSMSLGCLSFAKGHRLPVTRCGGGGGSAGAAPPHQPCPPFPCLGQVRWLSSPRTLGCRAPSARPYGDSVVPARRASGWQRLWELRRDDLS